MKLSKWSFVIGGLITLPPAVHILRSYVASPQDPQKAIGYIFIALFITFLWLMAGMTAEGIRRFISGKKSGWKELSVFGGIGLIAALSFFGRTVYRERLHHALTHATDPQFLHQQAIKALKKNDGFILPVIARNSSTPPETLVVLSHSEDLAVLSQLAQNPATPQTLLKELSQHRRYLVKLMVLQNPALDHKTIQAMAHDHDSRIRKAAAAKVGRIGP